MTSLPSELATIHEFSAYRPDEGSPLQIIRTPDEYHGSPTATISCTQTNAPACEQAKNVKLWCEVLPGLAELRFLWIRCHVPQKLFDAACRVPHLQGLFVKWSGVKDIDSIVHCEHITFFHLGSSAKLTSIEPLKELKNLVWLELENIKRISDLTVIGQLRQLLGLEISGSMWNTQVVDTLAPLAQLQGLRYLSLPNLKAKDKTLSPLFSLSSLEQFHAAKWWKEEDVRQLRSANPKL
jgi:hypothetical protein